MAKLVTLTVIVAAIAFFAMPSNDEAMAKCQQKHSFDTCFSSLNR